MLMGAGAAGGDTGAAVIEDEAELELLELIALLEALASCAVTALSDFELERDVLDVVDRDVEVVVDVLELVPGSDAIASITTTDDLVVELGIAVVVVSCFAVVMVSILASAETTDLI